MLYNQTNQLSGIPMPLMMGYTHPSQIQETGKIEPVIYDPMLQITMSPARMVGTKSLDYNAPTKKGKETTYDVKNVIDDEKEVRYS
jgi:hypothetical protein